MKIVYFGNGRRGRMCLSTLVEAGYHISLVVCLREYDQLPIDVTMQQEADKFGIPIWDSGHEEIVPTLEEMAPDVIVLAGYPKMISSDIYKIPGLCINLHAGPLPRYRGPHPLNWQLINGETQFGISIIEVDAGVDTGPIVCQEFFDVPLWWEFPDVVDETIGRYSVMLPKVLQEYAEGKLIFKDQDLETGFWCSRRYPDDGLIEWDKMTDVQVHNMVRALTDPMPSAFINIEKPPGPMQYVCFDVTQIIKRTYLGVPGRVVAVWPSGVVILCKNRGLLIKAITVDGEGALPNKVFPAAGGDL